MIEGLRHTCQLFVGAYAAMPTKRPRWLDDRRRILAHWRKGETELAVSVLRAHLEAAGTHLLERMGSAGARSAVRPTRSRAGAP